VASSLCFLCPAIVRASEVTAKTSSDCPSPSASEVTAKTSLALGLGQSQSIGTIRKSFLKSAIATTDTVKDAGIDC
jgi:hypothetical protein